MLGAGPLRVCNLYTLITQNIIISGMFYIAPVSVRCELLIKGGGQWVFFCET